MIFFIPKDLKTVLTKLFFFILNPEHPSLQGKSQISLIKRGLEASPEAKNSEADQMIAAEFFCFRMAPARRY
jgi:hypothetical protein